MLIAMRSGAKSWIVGILFGLLILSFAVWGIGDIFRGGGRETTVAEIGGVEISQTVFLREYQREMSRLQQRLGGRVTADMLARLGFGPQIVARMAEGVLYDIAAGDLGLLVDDATIAATIRSDPNFQGVGGFERLRYEQAARSIGLTPAGYEARLRRDIGRGWLQQAISASATAPKSLIDRLHKYRGERRVAEILSVPRAPGKIAAPDATAVAKWHADHARDYMAPELRAVVAIVLRPEDLMAGVKVDEARLKALYEEREDEFTTLETRSVTQLLFADETKAKAAHEALGAGRDFLDIAGDKASGGTLTELGTMTKKQLLPEVADTVFGLAKGAFSAPVESPFGWHVFRVAKIAPGAVKPFAEVREVLAEGIKRDRALEVMYKLVEGVEDELAAGLSMPEIGRKLDVKVVEIAALDARGNGPRGQPAAGLPKDPEFLRTAFAVAEGEESDVVETELGALFILQVGKVTKPTLRPLSEVRAKVVAAWTQDQAQTAAMRDAKAIAESVRGGRPLAGIASGKGLSVVTTKPFTRDGRGAGKPLSRGLVAAVFEAKSGAVVVAADAQGAVVARITEVTGADPARAKETRDKLARELAQAIGADLLSQYGGALERRYGVEIKTDAIAAALQTQ